MFVKVGTDFSLKSPIETTFKKLGQQIIQRPGREAHLEEIIRTHIDLLFPDEDQTVLIIGQQVMDTNHNRSDLIAIDDTGTLILIEVKRDTADMKRTEALESQAIRYAATCATIRTVDEAVLRLYVPYIEAHNAEYPELQALTSRELASRNLENLLTKSNVPGVRTNFNTKQRIIL